ncbi:MAG: DEAD/DEAH box helicase [Xanthomonadales bacterium]|nr:DEAD/DEAH box helicase [Xanthomonadales bacterium]
MSSNPLSDVRFDSLDLQPEILAGVKDAGFEYCTPIQAGTLPIALAGKDVAGQAQTGTGKTAAFLLATFHKLLAAPAVESEAGKPHKIRALMIAPTRELALQIHHDAVILGKHTGLTFGLAYGGVDYDKQRTALQSGFDILIGTPGRVIDFAKQGVYSLAGVEVMVLDEADRMFDLGFIDDIRFILRRLPKPDRRQSLMFSATLGFKVTELAYDYMNDPEMIVIEGEKVTADNVVQSVIYPANSEKLQLLVHLLNEMEDDSHVMVFSNTRSGADLVDRTLRANGFSSGVISGRVHQRKRQTLLRQFHDGELKILAATDVAARGLHIPDVTHVINFDLPQIAADYVHRVGRTARLGAKGDAISFACENSAIYLPDIEKLIGYRIPMNQVDTTNLPRVTIPPAPPRKPRPHGKSGNRGRSGGRSHGQSRRR